MNAFTLWAGGDAHVGTDLRRGRKSLETAILQAERDVAAISKFHGQKNVPMSRVLTFVEGCDKVDVKCYLHSDHFAPQGWYEPARRTVSLKMPFSF